MSPKFPKLSVSVSVLLSYFCFAQSQWVMYPNANPPPPRQPVIYYPQSVRQPYLPQPIHVVQPQNVRQPYQPQPMVVQPPQPYYPTVQPNVYPNPSYANNNNNLGSNTNNGLPPTQAPIVRTSLGQARGKIMQSTKGVRMYAYLGVPYAERPGIFQRAQPKRPWNGVLDVSELGPGCATGAFGSGQVRVRNGTGTDCLFLKILVPAQRTGLLPVLFWPHGGGFGSGSNGDYDIPVQGDNIIAKGVGKSHDLSI